MATVQLASSTAEVIMQEVVTMTGITLTWVASWNMLASRVCTVTSPQPGRTIGEL
jgi:hypothetical protein